MNKIRIKWQYCQSGGLSEGGGQCTAVKGGGGVAQEGSQA